MTEKTEYTLQELFSRLPISISELARKSGMSEVTVARIKSGKVARSHTMNRLLTTFSQIYDVELTQDNVKGINLLVGRYGEGKEDKTTQPC